MKTAHVDPGSEGQENGSSTRPPHHAQLHGTALGFVWANAGWILLITIATLVGAAVFSWSRTPLYRSNAFVLVQTQPGNGTARAPDMGTEKAIVSSGAVLGQVYRSLGISQEELLNGLTVTVPVETNVLKISYTSPSPEEAQRGAQAFAQQYMKTADELAPPTAQRPTAVVITPATVPAEPFSPDHATDLAIALVLGVALGLGVAFVRDRLDDRCRDVVDLEQTLEAPVLGSIPAVRAGKNDAKARLVVLRSPRSPATKAYRDLRTRLLQTAARRRQSVLLVTCPLKEDKTAVAANLAASLASLGGRVALLSADLPRGQTHELFGLDNRVGLSNLVEGTADLMEVLQTTEVEGLVVLPSGPAPADPGAVLQTRGMKRVLDQLRDIVDFAVIDAPPVLAGADTVALAELAEMILLVADAKRSTRSQVAAAAQELEEERHKLVGCALINAHKTSPRFAAQPAHADREAPTPTRQQDGNGPRVGMPHTDTGGVDALAPGSERETDQQRGDVIAGRWESSR